nr:MAG TPA: hypothetical protein [Caudoviricetes sp.]
MHKAPPCKIFITIHAGLIQPFPNAHGWSNPLPLVTSHDGAKAPFRLIVSQPSSGGRESSLLSSFLLVLSLSLRRILIIAIGDLEFLASHNSVQDVHLQAIPHVLCRDSALQAVLAAGAECDNASCEFTGHDICVFPIFSLKHDESIHHVLKCGLESANLEVGSVLNERLPLADKLLVRIIDALLPVSASSDRDIALCHPLNELCSVQQLRAVFVKNHSHNGLLNAVNHFLMRRCFCADYVVGVRLCKRHHRISLSLEGCICVQQGHLVVFRNKVLALHLKSVALCSVGLKVVVVDFVPEFGHDNLHGSFLSLVHSLLCHNILHF